MRYISGLYSVSQLFSQQWSTLLHRVSGGTPHGEPPQDTPDPPEEAHLERALRDALSHLYEPALLRRHPLRRMLGLPPGAALEDVLRDAVDRGAAAQESSPQARCYYRLLQQRYVEGKTFQETAAALSVSRSQYFKLQRKAIEALAADLQHQWNSPIPEHPVAMRDGGTAAPDPPPRHVRGVLTRLLPLGLLNAAALAVALTLLFLSLRGTVLLSPAADEDTPAVVHVLPGGNAVEVLDTGGQPVTTVQIDAQIARALLVRTGGGMQLAVAGGAGPYPGTGKDIGAVLMFDMRGQLLWRYDAAADYPYRDAPGSRPAMQDLIVGPLLGNDELQIAFIANDLTAYPSEVGILSTRGHLLAEYWHPGHLDTLHLVDQPEGPFLVVTGINRGLAPSADARSAAGGPVGVVFLLDPRDLHGEAPPYSGTLEHGSEVWYDRVDPPGATVGRVYTVDRAGSGGPHILLEMDCGSFLQVDENGRALNESEADGFGCPDPPDLVRVDRHAGR